MESIELDSVKFQNFNSFLHTPPVAPCERTWGEVSSTGR